MTTKRPPRITRATLALILGPTLTLGLTLSGPAGPASAQPSSRMATSSTAAASGRAAASRPLDRAALQADLDAVTAGAGVGAVAQVVGPSGTWSSASGVRRLNAQSPRARAGDRVRIASVTKAMVATLAMQEVQRGRWKLSTRVQDVLPGLLPGHGTITLAQLLSHRSGAPDYLTALLADATTVAAFRHDISVRYTDRQLVRVALTLPWKAPGSGYSYSNTNYVIVGLMLAHVNHRSVQSLLERRVFRPAHMTRSFFARTSKIPGRHLTEYAVFDRAYSLSSFEPSIFSSAGAVVSTARDVNRFYAALFTGKLLRPALVRQMRTPRTATPLPYGFGIFAVQDPCPAANGHAQWVYGHNGESFGTLTLTLSSPNARRQVAVSVTGRVWDPAKTAPPIEEFAAKALLATCPNPPATSSESGQPRSASTGLSLARLDRSATR